jgi:hypothetical protein
VYWLQNLDSGRTWKLHYIDSIPTSHRIRWADVDGDLNQELVNLPIIGIGTQKPEYVVGAALSYYRIPPDPVNSRWEKRLIHPTLHMANGSLGS